MSLDVSSRVLSELASREAALDAQIESAKAQAQQTIATAQAEAAEIIRNAEARVKVLQSDHEQKLTAEAQRIRDNARTEAEAKAQATKGRADGKLPEAVEVIMRAVLP